MLLRPSETLLFTGDSITDCGRARTVPTPGKPAPAGVPLLGSGYVQLLAARLLTGAGAAGLTIFNRGVSGDRIDDLEARLQPDLLALKPTLVSILIGINDIWQQANRGSVADTLAFRESYRRILERIRGDLGARIVILEPFLLPVPPDRRAWRADLDAKINAIRELAVEFADAYVPLDGKFAAACCESAPETWLPDGVHPSPAGHALIADAWMAAVA